MAIVNVEGTGMIGVRGVTRRIFGTLESIGVSAVLVSQASSEHSVTIGMIEASAQAAKEAMDSVTFKISQITTLLLRFIRDQKNTFIKALKNYQLSSSGLS